MGKRTELYHEALNRMVASADPCIERIRRCYTNSRFAHESIDPASLATIAGMDDEASAEAFAELRRTGFIRTDWSCFKWYQPSSKDLDDTIAELSAIEAAAIIRLSSMNCASALPVISSMTNAFLHKADGDCAVTASLAHNRMMLAIVSATGELRLMEEYVKQASVAFAYAVAARLDGADLAGMKRSAKIIERLVGTSEVRNCAAEAVAMRLHPNEPVNA